MGCHFVAVTGLPLAVRVIEFYSLGLSKKAQKSQKCKHFF